MNLQSLPRATLGRLPQYLRYLKTLPAHENTSATAMAEALGLGQVLVRKDLAMISGGGRPRTGYAVSALAADLGRALDAGGSSRAVIVGAGRLGGALMNYEGFGGYGIEILAAFDSDPARTGPLGDGRDVLPMARLEAFCGENAVEIGIIAVPAAAAQAICDRLVGARVRAIWNFSPVRLRAPREVLLRQEDLALSLAYLSRQIGSAGS